MAETDPDELIRHIHELTQSLDEHREELRVVRDAIDELRDVVDYLVRRLPDPTTWTEHLRRITSMPVDPAAPDFSQRVNIVSRDDLPLDDDSVADVQSAPSDSAEESAQAELF